MPASPTGRHAAVDVVIVGAGAAGGAAALEVAAAGRSFVGLDLQDAFGGTAATSGGGCCIAGSELQSALGIADSPELALADLVTAGGGEADEAWARFYLERAVPELYDWLNALGVEFVEIRAQEHNAVPRWHRPRGDGKGLMDALWRAMVGRRLDVSWHWKTTVTDLLTADGRVAGVRAVDARGRRRDVAAAAVVLATGGFCGDRDALEELAPSVRSIERLLIGGGTGARGTGHRLVVAQGGHLVGGDRVWMYAHATPDHRDASGDRGLVFRGVASAIWVDRDGRRFHDESQAGPGAGTPALLARPSQTAWAIFDRVGAATFRVADPAFRDAGRGSSHRVAEVLEASPYVHSGPSPRDLGRRAGIDPDGLERTLVRWNSRLRGGAGADPQTGRRLDGLTPIAEPPLYAVQLFPIARKNLGGVATDLRGRAVGPDGEPIPGLFAAGELAGFGGGNLSGRRALEGIMIGGSLFSGRVAGAWAAHAAGAPEPTRFRTPPTVAAGPFADRAVRS